ncbi:hypothetical protein TNIN_275161 [Trichonephila inaurata madagascariensis]|uniref:Uncharacterized protein n=1 Tax=Trichonephila inaurata madagascariensis TaxID=2747483 RepID=A0A8X6IS98_9ARAC|nr:hypothetical protein TNIN_275161 [Trichonephila inaurata madagascariensis]
MCTTNAIEFFIMRKKSYRSSVHVKKADSLLSDASKYPVYANTRASNEGRFSTCYVSGVRAAVVKMMVRLRSRFEHCFYVVFEC